MHHSITLVDFQLNAQNSYLFTYNTFIKILYMFWALTCSSSGGLCRNCIHKFMYTFHCMICFKVCTMYFQFISHIHALRVGCLSVVYVQLFTILLIISKHMYSFSHFRLINIQRSKLKIISHKIYMATPAVLLNKHGSSKIPWTSNIPFP
jgi:hypothetical protein